MERPANTHPVFVYGTLMRGQRANGMLAQGEYAGAVHLKDYAMYHLGSYPGIFPCPGEAVLGELYYVDEDTVAELDRYERLGDLYDRVTVTVTRGSASFAAQAYVYRKDFSSCPLMREVWGARDTDTLRYEDEAHAVQALTRGQLHAMLGESSGCRLLCTGMDEDGIPRYILKPQ